MTHPELAALYGRMSTGKQENSLDVQDTKCRTYCELKGLAIPDELVFTDPAVSGRKPVAERTGGADLLRALEMAARTTRPVRHLVVAKLDRLGRNAADVLATVKRLTDAGVTVHFVDVGGDSLTTSGPIGKLFLTLLAGFAEFEVEMIRQRTKDTMQQLRANGRAMGGTLPYGQRLVPADDGDRWEPAEEEQRVIRQMQALRAQGYNYNQIKTWLTREGIPSKNGRPWTYATVQSILEAKLNQVPA